MSQNGLVSVVIAVHNGQRFIADAVRSARRQSYSEVEIIVVDDGSSDESAALAKANGADVVIVLESNFGVSTARNVGIACAQGEFVTFLDCDDVMLPDRLASQVNAMGAKDELDCVVGLQRLEMQSDAPAEILSNCGMDDLSAVAGSLMVRRATFYRLGGFDRSLSHSEDMDLLFRVQQSGGHLRVLDEVLILRRVHANNATWKEDQRLKGLIASARSIFHRADRPVISVVIPVHDGEPYINEAVESVLTQDVAQSLEIIVIDDGSSPPLALNLDDNAQAVTVLRQPRLGAGAARNYGLLVARGQIVAFMDADDVMGAGSLRHFLEGFEHHPEVDACFGGVEEFVSPELASSEAQRKSPRGLQPARITGSLCILREAFARAGPFCTNADLPEFPIWYAQAVDAGLSLIDIDGPVLRRRIHSGNRSTTKLAAYPAALKQVIDRRRESPA